MPIRAEQLARSLERALQPIYLVSGDERLLADECAELIRAKALHAGFSERRVWTVETGFDWDELHFASQSMSLFAERRLLELRLPGGKPGESGGQWIARFAAQPPADTLLLIVAGKLDKSARDAKWISAIDAAGVHVTVFPVDGQRFPAWLRQRLERHGLQPGPGVVDVLAWHLEGNLLAAAQEVDKLVMWLGEGPVTVHDVEQSLADSARFTVFQLVDAALNGDLAGARRMLAGLRAEGSEPILVQWALAREIRSLVQLSRELAEGKPESAVLARVWQSRRAVIGKAVRRHPHSGWLQLLRRAAFVDRVIKGHAPGDRWIELERLLLAAGGLKIVANEEMEMAS